MASPTVAANAYANLARILDTGGAGKGSEAGGPSFGAVLKDAIGSVLEVGKKSEAQTQIQEQTLVFVPKILAIFVTLLLALPFMADSLHGQMMRISSRIIGG